MALKYQLIIICMCLMLLVLITSYVFIVGIEWSNSPPTYSFRRQTKYANCLFHRLDRLLSSFVCVQSNVSMAWITPFVAGIFVVMIWDSFTLILPIAKGKNENVLVSSGDEVETNSITSPSFLQRHGVSCEQRVAYLVETHSRWE